MEGDSATTRRSRFANGHSKHSARTMTTTVLFLCTGNYYRSRFAEHYFNALACQRKLTWRAESRGLQPSIENIGCISSHALARLRLRGIEPPKHVRPPLDLEEEILAAATVVVAVNEVEHRPLMQVRFPHWTERVRYWTVHDLDVTDANSGLAAIELAVQELLAELSAL